MRVIIQNVYSGIKKTVDGTADVIEKELLRLYPFLGRASTGALDDMVAHLNSQQSFHAHLVPDPMSKSDTDTRSNAHVVAAFLGHHAAHDKALKAARFLAGGTSKDPLEFQARLWEHDGDHEKAALAHHGLEVNAKNLKALRAHMNISGLAKSQVEPITDLHVEAGAADASACAEAVKAAVKDEFVVPVELGGKHSAGSMLARDDHTGETWLLKPGSGGQGPQAGEDEESASQSAREVAFWHAAKVLGMEQYYPEAQLLLINGKQVAAIHLLPWSYETYDKFKEENDAAARHIIETYVKAGTAHCWGVIDAILGNPDSHAHNVMHRGEDIKLVDHGSAFAGKSFSPGHDKRSFIPYYLRSSAPSNFSELPAHEKLRYMPRLGSAGLETLSSFLDEVDEKKNELVSVLKRYGVNHEPVLQRLAQIQVYASQGAPDLAVNRFWVDS